MRSKFKLGVQSGSPQQSWCRCAVHFFHFMIVHSRVIVTYTTLHTYPRTYLQWTVCQEKCLMRASFIDFFLNWLINLGCRIEVFQCNCTTGRGVEPSSRSALDGLQNCTGSSLHTCNTRSLSPRLQFSSKDRQDWCGIFSEMVKRESPTLPRVSFLWSLHPSHLISLKLRIVITSLPGWPFHLRFLHLHMRLAVLIWQETLKIASGIWWQMNIRGWSSLLLS